MDSNLQTLRNRVRRDRRRMLLAALVADFLAVALWLAPVAHGHSHTARALVTAALLVLAAACFRAASRAVDSHPAIRALVEGGQEVVWIYVRRIRRRREHRASWLQLGLASGALVRIALPTDRDHELMRGVSRLAPHATVGYDPVFERAFRADAASLRRGP